MAMISLPELKELRNRAEVNQNQSVEKRDTETQTEMTPTTPTMNELLKKYENDIENEKKKLTTYCANAKDAYTMYDTLITLFPKFTYCKDTGEIAINGNELAGSNLYEILQFISSNSSKKPPKGSAQILELLSQTYCPSTLFPNPVIRQIFRKYRHNYFKE